MKREGFSIVIPVYNKAPHLERSINSVLNQTYSKFELIIIDDGSTDGSLEIIQSFADFRIRIFSRKTPGPGGYAARNFGVQLSNFDWIAFLDADDEWDLEKLNKAYEQIKTNSDLDLITSGWRLFDSKDKITFDEYYQKNRKRGLHFIDLDTFLIDKQPIWTSVVIVKKELFIRVGGFDEKFKRGGDLELWFRLFLHGTKIIWLDYISATYYRNSVNMVTKMPNDFRVPVLETICNLCKKSPKWKRNRKLLFYVSRLVIRKQKSLIINDLRHRGFFINSILSPLSLFNKFSLVSIVLFLIPDKISKLLIKKRFI